jgi:hypothetical protein
MTPALGPAIQITGFTAQSTLAEKQFHAVVACSTAGKVKVGSASSDKILGILQNDPAAGEAAEIVGIGNSKAVMAAGVAFGDMLTVNSTGQLTTTTTAGDRVVAIALEASGGAGYIHPVLVVPGAH